MYLCAFQSVKSVGDGIARRDSHNELVGTVGDFSIHLYITCVPPPLKKCKVLVHYPQLTF